MTFGQGSGLLSLGNHLLPLQGPEGLPAGREKVEEQVFCLFSTRFKSHFSPTCEDCVLVLKCLPELRGQEVQEFKCGKTLLFSGVEGARERWRLLGNTPNTKEKSGCDGRNGRQRNPESEL